MSDLLDTVQAWTARGDRVAVATVVETKRSAPQPAGTKMAVSELGEVVGAVSGGCVEGAVVEVAESIIEGAAPQLLDYGIADEEAWDVGLPCGGEITIWVEAYGGLAADFAALAQGGERAALVTRLDDGAAKLLVRADREPLVRADREPLGTLGDAGVDEAALELAREALWSERSERRTIGDVELFVDVAAPPPRLLVFGAVDFAAQLCVAAGLAGWRTFVIDPRSRFATAERFPHAERVIAAWPEAALAQIDPIDRATAIAVLTHDPKLDDAALLAALASDAGYIGAMGSRRAQERRRERLLAAGVDEARLERIAAPIGLDLGALSAGETALSIMGEIVAVRRGRSGGRLLAGRGRIHEALAA